MHFIERVTGTGPGYRDRLYFATLPANFSADIPLPHGASLVGSVRRPSAFGEVVVLFYDVDEDDVEQVVVAYERRLVEAGWTEQPPIGRPARGFVVDTAGTTFCATGRPSISVDRSTTGSGRNLDITIQRTAVVGQCGNVIDLAMQPPDPLPRFVAPAATEMTTDVAQRSAHTEATLVSSMPLPALFHAFEAQLVAAHWQAVDKTIGKSTAIESFTFTDSSGGRWDAVLTLNAALDKANSYDAGVTATRRGASRTHSAAPFE